MKAMFPDHANNIIHDTKMRTIFDVLKSAYADGHSEVNIVVGADRRGEFESLANKYNGQLYNCLLYTSPSPRDRTRSRMPSSA